MRRKRSENLSETAAIRLARDAKARHRQAERRLAMRARREAIEAHAAELAETE